MKKRLLTILLSAVMLLSVLPLGAFAADEPTLDNFALEKDGTITWYSTFDAAFAGLKVTGAKSVTLKMFADAKITEALPNKDFTIDLNGNDFTFGATTIAKDQKISIINTNVNVSNINSSAYSAGITNYGKLNIEGYITVHFNISNNGGSLTFRGLSDDKKARTDYGEIENSNGGTVTLDCAYIFGDRAIVNNKGCTLNLTNGASFYSEVFYSAALTNYGTVNADGFRASAYQVAIDNIGGTLNLKNGSLYTTYSCALSTSGDTYIENCTISPSYTGSGISGSGTLTIKDSQISCGTSDYRIGLGFKGNLTVDNCTISAGNGIILTDGTATVTNSTISGTYYTYGVGISNSGNMTINNCKLYGINALSNGGTVTIDNSTIESSNFYWDGQEIAISNSGKVYCNNSTIKGTAAAYDGYDGLAEFRNCTISGFNLSGNYDPLDLYGNESTFYMKDGTVKLYDNTFPKGIYVVTDESTETTRTIKEMLAAGYNVYKTADDSLVQLGDTDSMLDGQYYIAGEELPDFGSSIADIDESNVTSDDRETIETEKAQAESYDPDEYEETIASNIRETLEKCDTLIKKLDEVQQQITQATDLADKLQSTLPTTDDIDSIDTAISQINSLLESKNITEEERADIILVKAKLEAELNKLTERKQKIDSIIETVNGFENQKPTTADEEKIQMLVADIDTLLGEALTQEEKNQLNSAKAKAESALENFVDIKNEVENLKAEFEQIDRRRINIFDKSTLEALKEKIDSLMNAGTLGGNELANTESLSSEVQSLIELIQQPYFYGIIRIFWTVVSMFKSII